MLQFLGALGLQTLGGIIGDLFRRRSTQAAFGQYQQAFSDILRRMPELQRLSLFAPAGTVGPQVRPAFETALASLTPSAESVGTAAALRSTAASLVPAAQQMAETARRQGATQAGEAARQIVASIARAGYSPTTAAAAAAELGRGIGQVTSQAAGTGLGAVLQALQQASALQTTAAQLPEASRSERFRTNVAPYMATSSPGVLASALGTLPPLPALAQLGGNPLEGLAVGLGMLGTQMLQSTLSDQYVQQLIDTLTQYFGRKE